MIEPDLARDRADPRSRGEPDLRSAGIPLGRLPTNLTTYRHAVHRWFNIIAGFSPEFVRHCIDTSDTDLPRLLDPFAGAGTALVEGNWAGVPSVGFEVHPFFADMADAKLHPPRAPESIEGIEADLLGLVSYEGDPTLVWGEAAAEFLKKLVPAAALSLLAAARIDFDRRQDDLRPIRRLILSRVLEAASGAQTDGIYKAPTSLKRAVPFDKALHLVCTELRDDISKLGRGYSDLALVYRQSALDMSVIPSRSCSLMLTSPPYLNNFDFAEMTRMELYYWGYATSWGEITEKIRRPMIVNTTTMPTDVKRSHEEFRCQLPASAQKVLDPQVAQLKAAGATHKGRKDYYRLVYPYFGQMLAVLTEVKRTLRSGSPAHVIVADAALYGVHIRTHDVLALLMSEIGFARVNITTLRTRGDRWTLAKRQGPDGTLGEYHVAGRA